MKHVYLIRHTAVDVPAGFAYGQTDVALKPSFEREAAQVKSRLAGLTFDQVWTSPLSRCVRLATYCGYPDALREPRLKEIHFGEWEMKSWEEISADPRSAAWFDDWRRVPTPGGESFDEQYRRVGAFLDELRRDERVGRACLFVHAGVVACARVYAGLRSPKDAFLEMAEYGEMVEIEV